MLSCKDATDKLSADIDGELSAFERLSLRFHQFICEDCKLAAVNMRSLVESMKDRPPSADKVAGEHSAGDQVDDDYVDRVMAALEKERRD